jgi:hypothetical protein
LADFFQVINAYARTNVSFLKYIEDPKNVVLGISPQSVIDFFAWKVHSAGLNMFDRSILLQNQLRTIATLVPVDF